MGEVLAGTSWGAVALAAVACYLLGALWFTPLFGRAWDRATGHDRRSGKGFGTAYYTVPLVGAAVTATVVGVLVTALAPAALGGALAVGAGVGLAAAAASVTTALTPHTPHPFLLGAVTSGYHLVAAVAAAAIVGAFAVS
jgi:hypothetical protein